MRLVGLPIFLLMIPAAAPAHDGHSHAPGWTLDPLITVPLLALGAVYLAGFLRLRSRSRRGRADAARAAWRFGTGWFVLAGSLVSPLHEAGESSFTMHMIEHELIMLVATLLLASARPGAALLWGLPAPLRRLAAAAGRFPVWKAAADPIVATTLQAIAITAWHVPYPFDLALQYEGWHIAQHLSFIGTSLLFWWSMAQGRQSPAFSALCLFATSMVGGLLGALMALASSPWYEGYAALGMTPIGLDPIEDQQLAGLLMWIPGGLFHLAAAVWFLSRWLNGQEEAPGAVATK